MKLSQGRCILVRRCKHGVLADSVMLASLSLPLGGRVAHSIPYRVINVFLCHIYLNAMRDAKRCHHCPYQQKKLHHGAR